VFTIENFSVGLLGARFDAAIVQLFDHGTLVKDLDFGSIASGALAESTDLLIFPITFDSAAV